MLPNDLEKNDTLHAIGFGANVSAVAAFGDNLKRLRLKANLNQSELSRAADYDNTAISKYESGLIAGLPEGPSLIRLAKALRCSVEELLAGVDPDYDAVQRRIQAAESGVTPAVTPTPEAQPSDSREDEPRRDPMGGPTDMRTDRQRLVNLIEHVLTEDQVADLFRAAQDIFAGRGLHDSRESDTGS